MLNAFISSVLFQSDPKPCLLNDCLGFLVLRDRLVISAHVYQFNLDI